MRKNSLHRTEMKQLFWTFFVVVILDPFDGDVDDDYSSLGPLFEWVRFVSKPFWMGEMCVDVVSWRRNHNRNAFKRKSTFFFLRLFALLCHCRLCTSFVHRTKRTCVKCSCFGFFASKDVTQHISRRWRCRRHRCRLLFNIEWHRSRCRRCHVKCSNIIKAHCRNVIYFPTWFVRVFTPGSFFGVFFCFNRFQRHFSHAMRCFKSNKRFVCRRREKGLSFQLNTIHANKLFHCLSWTALSALETISAHKNM